ncbi:hypothetical protein [Streptomyces sp. WAC 04229]|uniref:hypothetical protein n=1 Tax=Streptomyces sp. WAC 04229 TaxID=2203206 RepID=UPI003D720B00
MTYAEQEWAMAQESIRFQEHIDQGMQNIYGPLAYQNPEYPSDQFHTFASRPERPVPIGQGPFTPAELDRRSDAELNAMGNCGLMREQDEAYECLLESLSTEQRDALLVLAQNTPKQGLSQLVKALHREWKREQRRTPKPEES